jgi:hypothetical protein
VCFINGAFRSECLRCVSVSFLIWFWVLFRLQPGQKFFLAWFYSLTSWILLYCPQSIYGSWFCFVQQFFLVDSGVNLAEACFFLVLSCCPLLVDFLFYSAASSHASTVTIIRFSFLAFCHIACARHGLCFSWFFFLHCRPGISAQSLLCRTQALLTRALASVPVSEGQRFPVLCACSSVRSFSVSFCAARLVFGLSHLVSTLERAQVSMAIPARRFRWGSCVKRTEARRQSQFSLAHYCSSSASPSNFLLVFCVAIRIVAGGCELCFWAAKSGFLIQLRFYGVFLNASVSCSVKWLWWYKLFFDLIFYHRSHSLSC